MKALVDAENSPMAWTEEITHWWDEKVDANCYLFLQKGSMWEPVERTRKKWPFGKARVLFVKKTGALRVAFDADEFVTADHYAVNGQATLEYSIGSPLMASRVNVNLQDRVVARLQAALHEQFTQRQVSDLTQQISVIKSAVNKALEQVHERLGVDLELTALTASTAYQKVEETISIARQRLAQSRADLEHRAHEIRVLGAAETDVAIQRLDSQLKLLAREENEMMRLAGFLAQNPAIAPSMAALLESYARSRDDQARLGLLETWLSSQNAPLGGASSRPTIDSPSAPPPALGVPGDELTRAIEAELPGARATVRPGSSRQSHYIVERSGVGIRFTVSEDRFIDLRYADGGPLPFSGGPYIGSRIERIRAYVRDVFNFINA